MSTHVIHTPAWQDGPGFVSSIMLLMLSHKKSHAEKHECNDESADKNNK